MQDKQEILREYFSARAPFYERLYANEVGVLARC